MAKRVSSIYGNALFELAVEEKKVDALLSEVQTLQQILLENADLLSHFKSSGSKQDREVRLAEEYIFRTGIG